MVKYIATKRGGDVIVANFENGQSQLHRSPIFIIARLREAEAVGSKARGWEEANLTIFIQSDYLHPI